MKTIEQLLSSLSHIVDHNIQAHQLANHLSEHPEEEVVRQIQELAFLCIQGEERARKIFSPYLMTTVVLEILPQEKRLALYESATQWEEPIPRALFADFTPHKKSPKLDNTYLQDLRPPKILGQAPLRRDPITLGERRALAKSPNLQTLEKMLFDSDPKVIRNVLDNPRIQEKHVLKLASHRPLAIEILKEIGCHGHWGRNPRIRQAMIFNPYTPPIFSVISLMTAEKPRVRETMHDENLHPLIRAVAKFILEINGSIEVRDFNDSKDQS